MNILESIKKDGGLTLEAVIENCEPENRIHLKNMNGFEEFFFRIGFRECSNCVIQLMEELRKESKESDNE